MSKKSKKFEAEGSAPMTAGELAPSSSEPTDGEKKPRAPRIVRPRFRLLDANGVEKVFHHYALPTRRQAAGKVVIDGTETDFIVTKSQSRDKTEDRAYSYFTLPNGATGYLAEELVAGSSFTLKELPPAAPFGREEKAEEAAVA